MGELDALRAEVRELRASVQNMKKDMGFLAALVGDLSHQARINKPSTTTTATTGTSSQPPLKKQRLETVEPVKPDTMKSALPSPALPAKPVVPFGDRVQSGLSAV